MTDVERIVRQVQAAIVEAADDANEAGRSVLYSDLHRADRNVTVLAEKIDELQAELDHAYVTIGKLVRNEPDAARKVRAIRETLRIIEAETGVPCDAR